MYNWITAKVSRHGRDDDCWSDFRVLDIDTSCELPFLQIKCGIESPQFLWKFVLRYMKV